MKHSRQFKRSSASTPIAQNLKTSIWSQFTEQYNMNHFKWLKYRLNSMKINNNVTFILGVAKTVITRSWARFWLKKSFCRVRFQVIIRNKGKWSRGKSKLIGGHRKRLSIWKTSIAIKIYAIIVWRNLKVKWVSTKEERARSGKASTKFSITVVTINFSLASHLMFMRI